MCRALLLRTLEVNCKGQRYTGWLGTRWFSLVVEDIKKTRNIWQQIEIGEFCVIYVWHCLASTFFPFHPLTAAWCSVSFHLVCIMLSLFQFSPLFPLNTSDHSVIWCC
jgi:hypothetical protein